MIGMIFSTEFLGACRKSVVNFKTILSKHMWDYVSDLLKTLLWLPMTFRRKNIKSSPASKVPHEPASPEPAANLASLTGLQPPSPLDIPALNLCTHYLPEAPHFWMTHPTAMTSSFFRSLFGCLFFLERSSWIPCYGLSAVVPKFICGSPNLQYLRKWLHLVTRPLKMCLRMWVCKGNVQCGWCLYKDRRRAQRKTADVREDGHLSAKERLQEKPSLPTPWSWTSSLQSYEKVHFCGWCPPGGDTLLERPKLTNTSPKLKPSPDSPP